MPRVPTYDGFQVAPNTLPQAGRNPLQYSAPQTNVAAQQAWQAGQTLSQAGGQIGQVALQMQEIANQLRIDDAMNQLKEEQLRLTHDPEFGYQSQKGVNALDRPDGKPLSEEYAELLAEKVSAIEQSLGNSAQRRAFSQLAKGVLTDFHGQIMAHEAAQFEGYALSTTDGVIATSQNDALLNWNNPQIVGNAIKRIEAQVYRQAQLLGKSAEWQEARVRQLTSAVHSQVITSALEHGDVLYADAYLNKYAGQMEAADILEVRSQITGIADIQVGSNIGAEVFAWFAPDIAPNDLDRLVGIVRGLESGGRDFDDQGRPLTSSAGAKYAMQVLDSTAKDPGFGVAPAKNDSPEEYNRVGEELLPALIKHYNGNLAKALAAYNWGHANVDKAYKEHGENWLVHAPLETQNYVSSAMASFGAGTNPIRRPTKSEVYQVLEAQPELANNPNRLKHAKARVDAEWDSLEESRKAREEQALSNAYNELYANGGDMAALPPSIIMAIPGDKLSSVMTFADKSAKARHDPEVWASILSLPNEALENMTELDFLYRYRTHLDDAHLEKGYALIKAARGEADDRHLEIISTATRVKHGAIEAGIIPASGSPSKSQEKEFAEYQRVVDEKVRQFERMDLQGKRRANSEELQRIIDEVNMDTVKLPRWYWSDRDGQLAGTLTKEEYEEAYVYVEKFDEKVYLRDISGEVEEAIIGGLRDGDPDAAITYELIAQEWIEQGKPR